ncbi:MAG TPA: hypothetical protein VFS04_02655 [Alphaproteobacteria bacterium]|nr:hypothetical protein [Alphaproteobacteria bacterium]
MKSTDKRTYREIEFEVRAKGLGRFEWEIAAPDDADVETVGTVKGSRNEAVEACRAVIDAWLDKAA